MSEPKEPSKRVPIITPEGKFDTIGAEFAEEVTRAGGRVLSKSEADKEVARQQQQEAEKAVNEKYEALPTWKKAVGLIGGNPYAHPVASAVSEGTFEGVTAGLGPGAVRQGLDLVAGKQSGDEYAERIEQTRTASPYAFGVGKLAGTAAGLAMPVGQAAEGVAAARLAKLGIEGSSVLGRAGLTAAKLGVRGAVEGAAIGAGEYTGEQLLQDHEVATDKLFSAMGTGALYGGATGFALGGAGSLLSSGGNAARRGIASALARPVEAVEEGVQAGARAATDAVTDAAANVEVGARNAVIATENAAKDGIRAFASDMTTEAGMKNRAYDRVWGVIGKGFGLQSTEPAERAAKYLTNGTRDVGEVLMRKGIFDPKWSTVDAFNKGTVQSMLPRINSELEAVGRRIGEITDASGGTIDIRDVYAAVQNIAKKHGETAAGRPMAREIERFGRDLVDSLGANNGVVEKVRVQDVLRERKGIDDLVFENAALNTSNRSIQVKRELRSKLEELVVQSLDESSGRLSGELATEYKALKKDYLALSIASDVAEDSAVRADKASFLGLSSLAAGGGSIIKAIGHKVVKEHGDAVAATMLYQAAEKGTIARWLSKQDALIEKASKGLVAPPAKGAAKASETMPEPRGLATKALARVAAFQADPDGFVDNASRQTESLATHSPELASGLVTSQVRAMTFLASKVPQQGDPDPLDPHKPAEMTPSEQASFARYAWYVEKPDRFFAEVARGKLTPEGAETAQALMPRAFEQLQQQTFEALTTQLARGNRLPFRQRELLGQLLDFAATPAQRPEHRTFLQQNLSDMLPSNQPSLAAPAKPRRATTTSSGSALDRLEARGPGHR